MKLILFLTSVFCLQTSWGQAIQFPPDFFFGVANAPSQVEDQLDDIWMDFAHSHKVRAFENIYRPEERIHFWTQPEVELDLARDLHIKVFRLGIDWQRLFPKKGEINREALLHYRDIIQSIHERGMKVMLTLFHHTEPHWTYDYGGWRNEMVIHDFENFWQAVLNELGSQVDYLVTFNEAQVYALLSQVAGEWPYKDKPRRLGLFNFGPFKGRFEKSLEHMATAHKQIYQWSKERHLKFPIGIAHNVANYQGVNKISEISAWMSWQKMNYRFVDLISDKLDFLGLNYYGREVIKGTSVILSNDFEYSDSGRAIDPKGLYEILKKFDRRYHHIPFIITENGIADQNDWIRPAYLIEHLAAIRKAMSEGVKVQGYIHWTLTDNFEWADGYCPKFGLTEVVREGEAPFLRLKRESFSLFSRIAQNGQVNAKERSLQWQKYLDHKGQNRPQCRAKDGVRGLDTPRLEALKGLDWRFK
ncbi:MAG: hypothetical protein CO099_11645 [Bdellovibrio sp. CG_4_9_14_3_um_filter_39_7]|nr:MAG: hypothetical protein CO099_11645 [Bdellovibrio sp. CG_4_9_14_3_um_filter_39_7]